MVGYVADAELTPRAGIAARKIMHADSLASVANWMDEIRDMSEASGDAALALHHHEGLRGRGLTALFDCRQNTAGHLFD